MRPCLAAAALLAALPLPALGGAWTQPEGQGQIIISTSLGAVPSAAAVTDRGDTEDSYAALFIEYGLLEGTTVGLTAFSELPEGDRNDNTASVGLHLRQRLWQGEAGDVASIQIGVVQPIDELLGERYGGPGTDQIDEVSLRMLYGRGFGGDWGTGFVSSEGGFHRQLDGDEDELRLDVTGGYGPEPCCQWMLGSYATLPIGDADDASLRLAPSFAYTWRREVEEDNDGEDQPAAALLTMQLGISQDVLNIGDGFGVQLSIWRPF